MTDLTEIKRLAEAATQGEWRWDGLELLASIAGDQDVCVIRYMDHEGMWIDTDEPDAAFIATANPATVLSLIAQIERLTAEREKDRQALQEINDTGAEQDGALGRILRMQIIARARLEEYHG